MITLLLLNTPWPKWTFYVLNFSSTSNKLNTTWWLHNVHVLFTNVGSPFEGTLFHWTVFELNEWTAVVWKSIQDWQYGNFLITRPRISLIYSVTSSSLFSVVQALDGDQHSTKTPTNY